MSFGVSQVQGRRVNGIDPRASKSPRPGSAGRIHHAMRTLDLVTASLNMMLERTASRSPRGGRPGDKQLVQEMIADSWIELRRCVAGPGGRVEARAGSAVRSLGRVR
jgi:alkylation response protein AidB-like acyl-CoA dehydrogenase